MMNISKEDLMESFSVVLNLVIIAGCVYILFRREEAETTAQKKFPLVEEVKKLTEKMDELVKAIQAKA